MHHPTNAKYPSYPALLLTIGLFITSLVCLFLAFQPNVLIVGLAGILVSVTFFLGRFLLCGIGLGIIAVGFNAPTPYTDNFHNCQFDAQIIRPNYSKRHLGQEIRLYADNIVCGDTQLSSQEIQYWDNAKDFSNYIGKRLSVSANLTPIHSHLNLHSFDYERYLLSEGIRLSAKKLRVLESRVETSSLLRARQDVADSIFQSLSPKNAGIILTLLTGNRTALSPEQKTTMQATGTSHLLAISGLHLALIGGISWLLSQWLWALSWRLSDRVSPRHAGAVVALFVITIYAVFTGFDIPVKRAWIMFSLLILSWLFGRGLSNSSLLLAASVVLFISPYAVVSVGFYFSFLATFLVLWSARLPYSPLVNVLIMQALINLMLFPIIWLTFGIISPVAFFVNLLVIPWLGLWVLPWAVFASVVSFFSDVLATPIWALLDTTTAMLWQTIAFAGQLDWTLTPDFRPSLVAVILALSTAMLSLLSGKKWLFLGMAFVFIPSTPKQPPALLVADRSYTSSVIHNGKQAILINPGRRYWHINHAEMWLQYLQKNQLTLAAIVLENDKLTRISATKWLLDAFPETKVITAEKIDLPYTNQFCQPVQLEQLILHAEQQDNHCKLTLTWLNQPITLFVEGDNSIGNNSRLTWRGKTYNANVLGAITVSHQQGEFTLSHQRQNARLWRHSK